jgi:hypothetical protein
MEAIKSISLVLGWLLLTGALQQRDEDDRIDALMHFQRDHCRPRQPFDTAVARMDESRAIHCETYANTGYGRAARPTSNATMEPRK